MFLEIFAKERLVGEVHLLCYRFNVLGRILQHDAQFECHVVVYPFVGRALADVLHHLRQVFRRDAELLGIPADASLVLAVLFHHVYELGEDDVGACLAMTG